MVEMDTKGSIPGLHCGFDEALQPRHSSGNDIMVEAWSIPLSIPFRVVIRCCWIRRTYFGAGKKHFDFQYRFVHCTGDVDIDPLRPRTRRFPAYRSLFETWRIMVFPTDLQSSPDALPPFVNSCNDYRASFLGHE